MSKPTPKNEPAAYIGLAIAVAVAVAGHFLRLSDAQWQPILAAAPLVAGLATRFFVTPAGESVAAQLTAAVSAAQQDAATSAQRLADLQAAIADALPRPAPVVAPPAPVAEPVAVEQPAPAPAVGPAPPAVA